MHSLYYMYSIISKSQMSGEMSEFYTSVELNGIQMSLCHSVNKADFMTQLCEESERLFNESDDLHYKQQWLQINLKTLMRMMEHERNNSTRDTDLHVLQWRHGCAVERHSNGSVMFLQGTDEYAYDGQTLTFDLSNHWKPLVLDHDIIWNRESVSSLEKKCVETLTSFIELQRERKFIMKCFYPKHVQMEIRHNQTPLPDEQLNSDGIRPNADGSFQLMKSLEILPSETSQYQCVVEQQTDETKYFFIDEDIEYAYDYSDYYDIELDHKTSSQCVWDAVIVSVICILLVFTIVFTIVFTFYQLRNFVKPSKEQDTLKTPSSLQLSALHKTQMKPELLETIRAERCADLTDALNDDSDDENPTDPGMEEHTCA